MSFSKHISEHLRTFYFGKNWTWSNLKEHIEDVTLKEATTQITGLNNTILALIYHIHYYTVVTTKVLSEGILDGNDKFAFEHPEFEDEASWEKYKEQIYQEANDFVDLIANLSDDRLLQLMTEEKYGLMIKNLLGIIEHGHYHLGQIVLMKKLIRRM